MSKLIITNLCMIALLLLSLSLTCTARPVPTFSDVTPMKTHYGVRDVKYEPENCSGAGEEECLMRRTLEAHVDYIYTQKQKP